MIGGGLLNFGPFFGPSGRWRHHGAYGPVCSSGGGNSGIRFCASCCSCWEPVLTFNLGRDITLLVLWPVVFAYCFVRLIEIWTAKRSGAAPQVTKQAPSFRAG